MHGNGKHLYSAISPSVEQITIESNKNGIKELECCVVFAAVVVVVVVCVCFIFGFEFVKRIQNYTKGSRLYIRCSLVCVFQLNISVRMRVFKCVICLDCVCVCCESLWIVRASGMLGKQTIVYFRCCVHSIRSLSSIGSADSLGIRFIQTHWFTIVYFAIKFCRLFCVKRIEF